MNQIDNFIYQKNFSEALNECVRSNYNHLGKLLSIIINSQTKSNKNNQHTISQLEQNISGFKKEGQVILASDELNNNQPLFSEDDNEEIKDIENNSSSTIKYIKILQTSKSTKDLKEYYNKMTKNSSYSWNNIKITTNEKPDYYIIIDLPSQGDNIEIEKTIMLSTDPVQAIKTKSMWNQLDNVKHKLFHCFDYTHNHNIIDWNINKTYKELQHMNIIKDNNLDSTISTIISGNLTSSGDVKLMDFIKFLQQKDVPINVFGSDNWETKNYQGPLENNHTDNALFSYKYVINCETNKNRNYLSHRLIDGILSECLVFYSGCSNIKELIDEKSFVWLELSNFEKDYQIIKKAIQENWWEQRIEHIKNAKHKILNELSFFPILEKIINQ